MPKTHDLVPFDYKASGFRLDWYHYSHKGVRDKEEETDGTLSWMKANRTWKQAIAGIKEGDWVRLHAHGNGTSFLKGGGTPSESIHGKKLAERLGNGLPSCKLVVAACVGFQAAVEFARAYEGAKRGGTKYRYWGAMKLIKTTDELDLDDYVEIKEPHKIDLGKLPELDKGVEKAEAFIKQVWKKK